MNNIDEIKEAINILTKELDDANCESCIFRDYCNEICRSTGITSCQVLYDMAERIN